MTTRTTIVINDSNIEVVDVGTTIVFGGASTDNTSTIMRTAGAGGINGHRAVAIDVNGLLMHADPTVAESFIGISKNAAVTGDLVAVAVRDSITEPAWAWTPGRPVFFTAGGLLTQTPPTSVCVATVGTALTPTSILIVRLTPIFIGA